MGAISCVWRYQPHGALLIYQPHNTETRLGPLSRKMSKGSEKIMLNGGKDEPPPPKAQPKQMR